MVTSPHSFAVLRRASVVVLSSALLFPGGGKYEKSDNYNFSDVRYQKCP